MFRKSSEALRNSAKDRNNPDNRPLLFRNSLEGSWKIHNALRKDVIEEDAENYADLNCELAERFRDSSDDRKMIEPDQIFQYFQNQNKAAVNNHKRSISYNLQNMELASNCQNLTLKPNA